MKTFLALRFRKVNTKLLILFCLIPFLSFGHKNNYTPIEFEIHNELYEQKKFNVLLALSNVNGYDDYPCYLLLPYEDYIKRAGYCLDYDFQEGWQKWRTNLKKVWDVKDNFEDYFWLFENNLRIPMNHEQSFFDERNGEYTCEGVLKKEFNNSFKDFKNDNKYLYACPNFIKYKERIINEDKILMTQMRYMENRTKEYEETFIRENKDMFVSKYKELIITEVGKIQTRRDNAVLSYTGTSWIDVGTIWREYSNEVLYFCLGIMEDSLDNKIFASSDSCQVIARNYYNYESSLYDTAINLAKERAKKEIEREYKENKLQYEIDKLKLELEEVDRFVEKCRWKLDYGAIYSYQGGVVPTTFKRKECNMVNIGSRADEKRANERIEKVSKGIANAIKKLLN